MTNALFSIAGLSALPGERAQQVLELTFAGTPTKLPLFVLNGAADGPTVLVTAGVHGAEYVGIEAAMRLALGTHPAALHGRLVVAPISSMTAFAKRAIYIAPPDNKNLNRCFPGNPAGSFAEQLAAWLFQNLIRRADVYLDLHGGDMNEALLPFSLVKRTGDAALDSRALALAQAFGIPNIVAVEVAGSALSAAADSGVTAVLAEVGGQGLWPEHEVQYMSEGLQRALRHAGLLEGPVAPPPSRVLEQMPWVRSQHDGLFYPNCKVGDVVRMGQNVGRVADFLGRTVQEVNAPCDGQVLFLVSTLAMNNGDPLLAVGA